MSDHADPHLTALASILGGLTEYALNGHVVTAFVVGAASGAGAKLGGWLLSKLLAKVAKKDQKK